MVLPNKTLVEGYVGFLLNQVEFDARISVTVPFFFFHLTLTVRYSYSTVIFLLCVETAEVTPNC